MAQKGLLSKLSIQFNSKSNSESMEETQERGRRIESPTFCAMGREAHIRPINPTYQVENNTNDQLSPVTGQTKNPHTIDKNDQLSPVTGKTKNLNIIDENDHMSPVTGQTKNPKVVYKCGLQAIIYFPVHFAICFTS